MAPSDSAVDNLYKRVKVNRERIARTVKTRRLEKWKEKIESGNNWDYAGGKRYVAASLVDAAEGDEEP